MEFDRPYVSDSGALPPEKSNEPAWANETRKGFTPESRGLLNFGPERHMSTSNVGSHLLRTCPVSCVMDQGVDGMVRQSTGPLFILC
jgi:hypothetical protein